MTSASPPELDLHGVRARDARNHLVSFLASVRSTRPGATVRIITGLGLHSEASPVLHRLVREMLESRTLRHVAEWKLGADGGSFLVRLTGAVGVAGAARTAGAALAAEAVPFVPNRSTRRLTEREWTNARRLEHARRRAEREIAAAADEAAEARRLEQLKAECGGRELPDWLRTPPPALEKARAERARQEAADQVEYGISRAEYEARRGGG